MIFEKSREDIDRMSRAGVLVARVHETLADVLRPGMTTLDLDRVAEDMITAADAAPSFKGYRGFPATLCTSRNHQIVHGIPSADVVLEEGDLLSIDCGAIVEGFHADSATTLVVGGPSAATVDLQRLVTVTYTALWRGLEQVRDGRHVVDIGAAIGVVADDHGYGLVRDYVGHGIGRSLHEPPSVPNHGVAGRGMRLREGIVVAVEPMFTLGGGGTRVLEDGWTVETVDGSWSAHWEHTVALTRDGPRILTARSDEPIAPIG